jgi:hypothetical protein
MKISALRGDLSAPRLLRKEKTNHERMVTQRLNGYEESIHG